MSPPSNSPETPISSKKAEQIFRLHPAELNAFLELAWEFRVWENDPSGNPPLGHPNRRSDIPQLPEYLLDALFGSELNPFAQANRNSFRPGYVPLQSIGQGQVRWDHLIYAYLIENTRIYEIFRRVIHEYRHGERLGVPLASSQHWLRNTEELFFRDPSPFSIYSVVSYVRSDQAASRRNAYYRMFGMDLNHGMDDNKSYPYIKPDTANREFVSTFEEFLREVWVGIANSANTSGLKQTDDAAISNLARRLHDMLRTRRTNGNLSQEEFWFVSTMSWFHLSLEFDSPIVVSLRAEGASEEERLKKIAERVKVPAHAKSYYFFRLADPLSRLLTQIEIGTYNNPNTVRALYTDEIPLGTPNPVEDDMRLIITYWSYATDRNMKEKTRSVTIAP
ncbi:MAG: hypothetical protein HC851_08635 [Acaryochloris sp. RU_4_1]|nr:hypothetical protein [Acaryochloris sp. RU_4_1]